MMERRSDQSLREALHAALRRGASVVLATVSPDGQPSSAFCSWVLSLGNDEIAVALDSRSTGHRNISAGNNSVALEVLAEGLIVSVRGTASIAKEQLRSVPFPCALVTVAIAEVRDHGVPGVHFHAPHYLWADGKEHRGEVERAIFEELAESRH
ncbi:MAG TPA: pyridoxamine 5'-phosphate oxidase family protein [Candidatus Eremiobacteraceae bacterium]|nr:pyridoxamine 5'-phosphate oxidase family protein [Candidatus Eremiobacteraceae bacterium]